MTYATIKSAAESRMGGDSTGAWALADALVADLPNAGAGGRPSAETGSDGTTSFRLQEYAAALEADGIETPSGNPYTAVVLRELRLVALGWPMDQRQPLAAFRTHQEAGTADPWKREVLAALCRAARTRAWDEVPEDVDAEAWALALHSVRRKVDSGTRYPVSANDLRTVLRRRVNVPPPPLPEVGDMRDAIRAVAEVRRLSVYAVKILATNPEPTGEWLEALGGFADTLDMLAGYVRTLVSGGGVTDESLEALLAQEGR